MVSGKVPDNRWVPDDPLVPTKQPIDTWRLLGRSVSRGVKEVPDDHWEPDDSLICDDCQSETCRALSGMVPDDH